MEPLKRKFETVDDYFSVFPAATRKQLQAIRKTIQRAAPGAEERISYNIPAFRYHGELIYYAAHKSHIGMYPVTAGLEKTMKKELAPYRSSKASLRFPLDEPLPLDLISRIVKTRVSENREREAAKKKK